MEPSDVEPQPTAPDERRTSGRMPAMPALPPPPSMYADPFAPQPGPASVGQPNWGPPDPSGITGFRPAHQYRRVVTPWWQRLLPPVLVVALIAGIVALAITANHSSDDAGAPDSWDTRVEPIADFVSETRELEWSHPVRVEFLPEAEFVALFDQPDLSNVTDVTDPREAQLSALYNAKGLAVGYDPEASQSTVQAVTTLGFYSPGMDRVDLRGNELTPAVRVVLAHELTHALQAQNFDLNARHDNELVFRAMVEADALRVENVYRDTLSADEQQQADAGNTLTEEASASLDSVPWALIDQSYAPYVLGPNLVNTVFAARGNAGVSRLISTPPTEEILLNPWLFDTEQREQTVSLTPPADSTSIDDVRPMSPVELLIILDAWLPFEQARAALDGWGTGWSTSYETADDVVCFAGKVAFDDGKASARFHEAIEAWGTAMGSAVDVHLNGATVRFEACDRGADATPTPEPIISPMFALSLEHDAISLAGTDPTPAQIEGYRCFAATLIDDPVAAPLLATQEEFTAEQDATFTSLTDAAAETCGVPPLER